MTCASPHRAVLVRGDGVGPEVIETAVRVLDATGVAIEWEERAAGWDCLQRCGEVAPAETLAAIRRLGTALKGPFTTPSDTPHRSANYYIRRELDLYACVRPIADEPRGIDLLLVRENVEDHYGAIEWMATPDVAQAVKVASRAGCERIARFAFALARSRGRRRVTVVHKANNLKLTEGMFLRVALEVAREHPDLAVDDLLADAAAAELVTYPGRFDVVLTSNTFGDLLANVGAAVAGGLGLVASANHGPGGLLVTEPGHGSAPELAGLGRANPLAAIGAGAMLLAGLGRETEAAAIEQAMAEVRREGLVTPDLGGVASTAEVGDDVSRRLRRHLRPAH
jgi:isocitrate dehydrogenase (NAD+)